jgi:PadR family transcriptional regulator PadR
MAGEPKLSHTAAMILQAIHAGHIYGFSVMEVTGLPSGTVYPAMRRLERDYKLTRNGRTTLDTASKRYPLITKLIPSPEVENA